MVLVLIKTMHFLFWAAKFEFMTRFLTMILYFSVCTVFTAGPNIKWDVLHALQFCTGRYSYGYQVFMRDCKYSQILPYTPLFSKTLRHPLKASAAGPPMGRAAQLATSGCRKTLQPPAKAAGASRTAAPKTATLAVLACFWLLRRR